ncbi:YIP1 family protein [Vallitalea guaymasensis]|uniref:DUF1282 family protein n=1 Tax=Vallitalea guaymasensis TaxID=1185412 RepID=A0A8J8M9P5_9FIRM|nr:YIP1 family protein [Vallitalea guaymasensis]QUH28879.1 DUF1282 family protein [Vallitalea guaymasensis]
MRNLKNIFLMLIMVMFFNVLTVNAEAPYNTYTSDKDGYINRTQTAYTPMNKITTINNEKLKTPEHVFVDKEDYIYITDSGHNKIFILNKDYKFYKELASDKFGAVKSTFVTEDKIYVVDSYNSTIFVFDKNSLELLQEIGEPDSPIFKEGYKFRPTNIAVDIRGNIYVRSTGSIHGLMMLNREGEFLTFFGANPLKVPIVDKIRSYFLTEKQEEKLEKVFPDVPTNLAIDGKGFIYTVTSSIKSNPVKKFNISGTNYFPNDMVGIYSMESVWVGQYNNVFTVSSEGWVFEYDSTGNLLFLYGGKDFSSSRLGLLNRPISIATNSMDDVIIIDQGTKLIQTYRATEFTNAVHKAMLEYQEGNYEESEDLWSYTLKYNSIFDNAHVGLGDAYLRNDRYELAYDEYYDARYNSGISKAFWEIRQVWLENNLNIVLIILLILLVIRFILKLLNKKTNFSTKISKKAGIVKKVKIIDDMAFVFEFLKHPLDGFYKIKMEKRVSKVSSTIIYLLVIASYIAHKKWTNVLFVSDGRYFIGYKLFVIIFVAVLWIVSNYLICSINDGEGSISNVYNATAYALTPIIVIMPFVIAISNVLTLEQAVFYRLPIDLIIIWVLFLMFFMIKDIHNFEVGETCLVILRSIFTMLIIALFLFVLYSLGNQIYSFLHEIIREVITR